MGAQERINICRLSRCVSLIHDNMEKQLERGSNTSFDMKRRLIYGTRKKNKYTKDRELFLPSHYTKYQSDNPFQPKEFVPKTEPQDFLEDHQFVPSSLLLQMYHWDSVCSSICQNKNSILFCSKKRNDISKANGR